MLTYHDHDLLPQVKPLTATQRLTLITPPTAAFEKEVETLDPSEFDEHEFRSGEESFGSLNPCNTRTYTNEEPDELYD